MFISFSPMLFGQIINEDISYNHLWKKFHRISAVLVSKAILNYMTKLVFFYLLFIFFRRMINCLWHYNLMHKVQCM